MSTAQPIPDTALRDGCDGDVAETAEMLDRFFSVIKIDQFQIAGEPFQIGVSFFGTLQVMLAGKRLSSLVVLCPHGTARDDAAAIRPDLRLAQFLAGGGLRGQYLFPTFPKIIAKTPPEAVIGQPRISF